MSTLQEFEAQKNSQAVPGVYDWGARPQGNFVQGVKEVL